MQYFALGRVKKQNWWSTTVRAGKDPFENLTKVLLWTFFADGGWWICWFMSHPSSVREYQTNCQGHLGRDRPLRTIVPTTQGWYVHCAGAFLTSHIQIFYFFHNWSFVFQVGSSLCLSRTFDDSSLGLFPSWFSVVQPGQSVRAEPALGTTGGGRDEKNWEFWSWKIKQRCRQD